MTSAGQARAIRPPLQCAWARGPRGISSPPKMPDPRGQGAAMSPQGIKASFSAERNQQTFTTKCLGEIRNLSSAVNFSSLSPRQGPQDPGIQDSHEGALKSDMTRRTPGSFMTATFHAPSRVSG